MDWKSLWKSVQEPLRWLVLAIIPFIITFVAGLPYEWAIPATVILRIIDGYLHYTAKEQPLATRNEGYGGVKGLTNF